MLAVKVNDHKGKNYIKDRINKIKIVKWKNV